MDVGDWLRSLGLGQYEPAFRDNGIDAEVLPDLTDADLEKLGVLLGHRKRAGRLGLVELVRLVGVVRHRCLLGRVGLLGRGMSVGCGVNVRRGLGVRRVLIVRRGVRAGREWRGWPVLIVGHG